MQKPLLLLTTCGTSILTNGGDPPTRKWLTDIANRTDAELDPTDRQRLAGLVALRTAALTGTTVAEQCRQSAELNSINAVLRDWQPARVQHVLLHTDTATGRATAAIVGAVLESSGPTPQSLTAGGLRTSDPVNFRASLPDLTSQIRALTDPARKSGTDVVFNLTGGFKSVSGYLQAIGMVLAGTCVFLFEGESALMRIPRAPLREFAAEDLKPHRDLFRRLSLGYQVSAAEAQAVPDTLLFEVEGQVQMSPWADLLWAEYRDGFYAGDLLPPLSPRLRCEPAVAKTFGGLEPARQVQVNEALDLVSTYLDFGREPPKSHKFKALVGYPTATYEMYLWSDGAAWRLVGSYDAGQVFVAKTIGKHL